MKKTILAAILLAIPLLAADDNKPMSPETQIKLLKGVRQMQQVQIQMADIQRQCDQGGRRAEKPPGGDGYRLQGGSGGSEGGPRQIYLRSRQAGVCPQGAARSRAGGEEGSPEVATSTLATNRRRTMSGSRTISCE